MAKSTITINSRYKSSTRIDSTTAGHQEFIDDFIVHGTTINTLDTLSREFSSSAQKAYTLTGPYGSGKSTLAMYLSYLLSAKPSIRNAASEKLRGTNADLAEDINERFEVKKGWTVIRHVCGLESPAPAILISIKTELGIEYDQGTIKAMSDSECLDEIKALLSKKTSRRDGLILLLDEMGKALDYQSRANKDLHLFQSLADIAQQAKSPVMLIGFLHQAFTEYAKNKDASAQREWAKVQGRYRDLNYNPSIDESLVLVGQSIVTPPETSKSLIKAHKKTIEHVAQAFKQKSRNTRTLENTLPLDPIVSLLLGPISRRRFSQNERSIFGFLASQEKLGFREFLAENYEVKSPNFSLYRPEQLWDYLHHNLHHLITTSQDSKAWLEGCDAIHRAEQKGDEIHVTITKVIALLTIFGFHHQLHASKDFLVNYFKSIGLSDTEGAIDDLVGWTVIIFRQNHGAYFIFQGSDIDINNMVLERIESISHGIDWSTTLEDTQNILATAHYHEKGTMRWANTKLVQKLKPEDVITDEIPLSGESYLSFILATVKVDKATMELAEQNPYIVIGASDNLHSLQSVAIELAALKQIKKDDDKIKHDLIAKKEIQNRISLAERDVSNELNKAFQGARWKHKGNILSEKKSLSQHASEIADQIYSESPPVFNELVNRSKPSGSANSAIRKLMAAMLDHGESKNLDFPEDTYPAEKAIYLSCLKSKGWHQDTDEGSLFPSKWSKKESNKNPKMYALLRDGIDLITSSKDMVTIDELYNRWMSPPFGLTAGLCRLYALALLKSMDGQIAFYDLDSTSQFIFIPELDEELLTKIYKRPKEAGVRYFHITSVQSHLVNTLAKATESNTKRTDDVILNIAKHIVKVVHTLPSWVKKTSGEGLSSSSNSNSLSTEALSFRNKVIKANDPYNLILEELPTIFGSEVKTKKAAEALSSTLAHVLSELEGLHDQLIGTFKQVLESLISTKLDETLKVRCENVVQSSQRPDIKEFAVRLIKHMDGKVDFEQVMNLAIGAPEKSWTDTNIRNGLDELRNLCTQFRRVESFGVLNQSGDNFSKPVALISADKNGKYLGFETFIAHSLTSDKEVKKIRKSVEKNIKDASKEQKIAALSQLLESLMDPEKASNA